MRAPQHSYCCILLVREAHKAQQRWLQEAC
jgi:hypothetical protein